jgi:hypothetical protein
MNRCTQPVREPAAILEVEKGAGIGWCISSSPGQHKTLQLIYIPLDDCVQNSHGELVMRMNGFLHIVASIALLVPPCAAQTVFWSYFLDVLPPGWSQGCFTFGPDGALYEDSGFWYPAQCWRSPRASFLQSDTVIVPAAVDSIVLSTCQSVILETTASSQGYAGASVTVYAYINGVPSELWQLESYSGGGQSDSTASNKSLLLTLPPVIEGDEVIIQYDPHMWGYKGMTWVTWLLWDSELTGYPGVGMTPQTWGGIKTLF